ncbi:MAG: RNB domain-containing ribonuclease [Spirochaetaceae bacterium]|jgi:exoribonuclease-2|nr:RNB domain-containing ribonuclease [Spirochaetaceae bacterium]
MLDYRSMISEKSLVVYKNRPALVTGTGEKIEITLLGHKDAEPHSLRVREKDVEALHPGPVTNPAASDWDLPPDAGEAVRDAWELLEGGAVSSLPLRELAELIYSVFSPQSAWAAYGLLRDGLYFSGTIAAVSPRSPAEVSAEEQKRAGKRQDQLERDAFLKQLRSGFSNPGPADEAPPDEARIRRFLQDVEALAWGKTDKSRTLRDLGKAETPQEAHRLLLDCRAWTPLINPHPLRFGLDPVSAREHPGLPPEEGRLDLTRLRAYAVDNAYSSDPDDALSVEGDTLYVHVADPAASVLPGSAAEQEARARGVTLYLPEGPSRMLAEEALPIYALGLEPVSPALTFKIVLAEDGAIAETRIFPSLVRVRRLTYAEADAAVEAESRPKALSNTVADAGQNPVEPDFHADMAALFRIAGRNLKRRLATGAVSIELPEVHIAVTGARITITPDIPCRSAAMVRECMLLAGEGAARWASRSPGGPRLPFPYVCQETGDLPAALPPGLAGAYQLRRCMRPRSLSVKPGSHWGLGLNEYAQVTSPLRRYTDLLAHQQIRAALKTGLYRDRAPLEEDTLLPVLAAGEAAAQAAAQAERASRLHWTAVYLSDKKDSSWEGVLVDRKGNRGVVIIPDLGLETQVPLKGDRQLNDPLLLTLSSVRIPEGEAVFILA